MKFARLTFGEIFRRSHRDGFAHPRGHRGRVLDFGDVVFSSTAVRPVEIKGS